MYYFKFLIPKQDGDRTVAYSPNWFGTMPRCPRDVTVLMLNDKEGYGIAKSNDTFVPPEVEVITAGVANSELGKCIAKEASIKGKPDFLTDLTMDGKPKSIWWGANLTHRWDEEVLDG